ncbi:MAG: hypothetical protein LBG26_01250 [Treponema sp.]|jgi:hypothetical protein|nr:hypothetical protein [Treponema sp.]
MKIGVRLVVIISVLNIIGIGILAGVILAAHADPGRIGKDMRQSETDTFGSFDDQLLLRSF